MPHRRGKKYEILRRRELVAELYLQGWTQGRIASELGISQPTVSQDLRWIEEHWKRSAVRDFDTARQRELRKLDLIERAAWDAWQRSGQPHETTKVINDADGNKRAHKTVQQSCGDPRFLEQIHKCIASRRALLGLDAPTKISPTSPEGDQAYHAHVMAELMRLSEQAGDGPRVIDADYISSVAEQHISGQISIKDKEANDEDQ